MNTRAQPSVLDNAAKTTQGGDHRRQNAGFVLSLSGCVCLGGFFLLAMALASFQAELLFVLLALAGVFSVVGLVLSARRLGRRQRGLAVAGTILGTVGCLGIISIIALILDYLPRPPRTITKRTLTQVHVSRNGPLTQTINLFRFNTGVYPGELKYLIEKPGDVEIAEQWTRPYIEDPIFLQDPWGRAFKYSPIGIHNVGGFDLWSLGPDGIDGTADDITNWRGRPALR